MQVSRAEWNKYVKALSRLSDEASSLVKRYIAAHGIENIDALIDFVYRTSSTIGEAATALACTMYDEMAIASGVTLPAAVPAEVATYGEIAAAVNAVSQTSPSALDALAGRYVKRAAADTTLQNAERDEAEFAWIPHGDTCAYCLTLAALGWRKAGKLSLKGGHAEHIHSHCDCEYAIRFNSKTTVAGYDPDAYNRQIVIATGGEYNAESMINAVGRTSRWEGRDYSGLNKIRREFYAEDGEAINAQKRAAYAARRAREHE